MMAFVRDGIDISRVPSSLTEKLSCATVCTMCACVCFSLSHTHTHTHNEQRHVENARYVWMRFVEKNRREIEEKSEQLRVR